MTVKIYLISGRKVTYKKVESITEVDKNTVMILDEDGYKTEYVMASDQIEMLVVSPKHLLN